MASCGERVSQPGSNQENPQKVKNLNGQIPSEKTTESRPAPMGQPASPSEPARTPKNWAKDKASNAMDKRYGAGLDDDSTESE